MKEPVSDYAMAGFGLTIAHTPLFRKRGIALSFSIVKSFKQLRALANWFVLSRLCGCSASRAWLGTKAHFGDDREVGPHPTSRCTLAQLYFALANFKSQLTYYEP